jgi:PD-(D/E)XK nuclease superfamily
MAEETKRDNLLVSLHKRVDRQDENFLTDVYAHLLRHLRDHVPEVASGLLRELTGTRLNCSVGELHGLQISTQVITKKGTLDLEIRTADHLVCVEVKKESGLGDDQMSRYREHLDDSGVSNTTLVLLTKYLVNPAKKEQPDVFRRWYQVAAWIEAELEGEALKQPVSIFLATQFLDFLKEKNMTLEQVGKDLVGGVRSLRSILAMIAEAIPSQEKRSRVELTLEYAGYYVNGGEYFVGLYHDSPGSIFFETWKCPVMEDAVDATGFGYIERDKEAPSRRIWAAELKLLDEPFFDRPRVQQAEVIERFLAKCFKAAPLAKGEPKL